MRLASALRAMGRYDEAAAAAGRVLVVRPDDLDALLEQGRAKIAQGQAFYAIAPLAACAVLPATPTATFAAVALGLTAASHAWNGQWGLPQMWVRLLDVALVSGAAVAIAAASVQNSEGTVTSWVRRAVPVRIRLVPSPPIEEKPCSASCSACTRSPWSRSPSSPSDRP